MNDIKIRQGATLERTFTDKNLDAQTLTITISNDTGIILTEIATYQTVDAKRVATLLVDTTTLAVAEYEYMYTIVYDDKTLKLPDPSDCEDGNCTLPKLIICEANDVV